jgi:hypothetical protein
MERALKALQGKRRLQLLLLLMLVGLATILRVYRIGEWSFWGDEWITVQRATSLAFRDLEFRSVSLLTTRLTLDAWGISETTARLPAAVIGVLTIPALYLIAERLFDPLVALLSSLFLSVSQWHLYWSQSARFYTALLLFFTIALVLFFYGFEKDRPLYLVLSLVFLGLAVKERDVAAFLGPITAIYVICIAVFRFEKPSGFRTRNLLLFFGPGVILGSWMAYRNFVVNAERWNEAFSFVNNSPFWILAGSVFYIGLPLACFSVAGALILLRAKDRAGLLLALSASVPILGIMILALFQYTANRYVFISLTSLIILGAVAARELLQNTRNSHAIVALGALAILILQPMSANLLYYHYQHGNRGDWKAAFAYIRERAQKGDRVVTIDPALADYYMEMETAGMIYGDVDAMLGNAERTWFVVDLTVPDKVPAKYRWILNNARHVAAFDVSIAGRTYPMRVYLYEAEPKQTTRADTASDRDE